jgi:hypothetical protein
MRLPFQSRILHFEFPDEPCNLPFAVGGATQHHWDAVTECQNSQDAVSIAVTKNAIVAVVTDGCTGTHPNLEATSRSSNEVGAKLLAYMTLNATLAESHSDSSISPEHLVEKVAQSLDRKLSWVLRALAGPDPIERQIFAFDFLMATVLCFVITEQRYIVFHCGDGIIGLNGKIHSLEAESGSYLANEFVTKPINQEIGGNINAHRLKLFETGFTADLKSIFLATDGLSRLAHDYPLELAAFTDATPPKSQINNGFDFLLQEFRQKVAWNESVALTLDDDATFALVRRYSEEQAIHDHT